LIPFYAALVEKSIEISKGFLHRKLAYGAPKGIYGAPYEFSVEFYGAS
jgi:hypothetical protein